MVATVGAFSTIHAALRSRPRHSGSRLESDDRADAASTAALALPSVPGSEGASRAPDHRSRNDQ